MKLSDSEICELQRRYHYLVNYDADDDLTSRFDPLTYIDSNGDTLLHIAAQVGDAGTVEMLLKAGLDVDRIGDMGCTALHYAKMEKQGVVVDLLLAHGASKDIRNEFGKLSGEE
jgi:ankyrin repeat protein